MRRCSHRIGQVARDERGAALPEFAIAIFPLLWLFFGFSQVGYMMICHLIMHHAAVVGTRCAAVVKGPNLPGTYVSNLDGKSDNGDAPGDCTTAARDALGPVSANFTGVAVIPTYVGGDPFGDVDVTTIATFHCRVPLGQRVVCGGGETQNFTFEIKLPHEGAQYALEDGASNCGGTCTGDAPGSPADIAHGGAGGALGGFGGGNVGGNGGFTGGGGSFGGGGASGGF